MLPRARSGPSTIRPSHARIIDGGFKAWTAAGSPVDDRGHGTCPDRWLGTADPTRIATWRDVVDRLAGQRRPFSTRSDADYYAKPPGETRRRHPRGRAPRVDHNLTPDGKFKSPDDLRAMYAAAGITPDREVVTYCQAATAPRCVSALKICGLPGRPITPVGKEWATERICRWNEPPVADRSQLQTRHGWSDHRKYRIG